MGEGEEEIRRKGDEEEARGLFFVRARELVGGSTFRRQERVWEGGMVIILWAFWEPVTLSKCASV